MFYGWNIEFQIKFRTSPGTKRLPTATQRNLLSSLFTVRWHFTENTGVVWVEVEIVFKLRQNIRLQEHSVTLKKNTVVGY